jgi:hypothetical protein
MRRHVKLHTEQLRESRLVSCPCAGEAASEASVAVSADDFYNDGIGERLHCYVFILRN